jgi:hypothetical protein
MLHKIQTHVLQHLSVGDCNHKQIKSVHIAFKSLTLDDVICVPVKGKYQDHIPVGRM